MPCSALGQCVADADGTCAAGLTRFALKTRQSRPLKNLMESSNLTF